FLINLLMGLTPISVSRYYFVSQLGMLPGTAVYLNAGTQLAQIETLSGIVSPSVLASFALLGLFPIIVKWLMSKLRSPQPDNGHS
ncbi:dihydrolipoamide dehydrogenase, partial [Vibrio xuii]